MQLEEMYQPMFEQTTETTTTIESDAPVIFQVVLKLGSAENTTLFIKATEIQFDNTGFLLFLLDGEVQYMVNKQFVVYLWDSGMGK